MQIVLVLADTRARSCAAQLSLLPLLLARGFILEAQARRIGYKRQIMVDEALLIEETSNGAAIISHTTRIVSAYVGNNRVEASALPELIRDVHSSLSKLTRTSERSANQSPAVPINCSITDEFLICLEDGKQFKSLKRHLRSKYNLSPEEYREKWGLPYDYPMVAPAYARQRSQLAKEMGLGQGKPD